MAFLLFLAFALPLVSSYSDIGPYRGDANFDHGKYGHRPMQNYRSTDVQGPRVNLVSSSPECVQDLYTMITPRGGSVTDASATILDQNGNLVWSISGKGQIYNLMAQDYKGERFLTFWAGSDAVQGHGAGKYYMYDSSYTERYVVEAANGLDGDLHEFYMTKNDTVLMTVYNVVPHDLTPLGFHREQGHVWDCLVQEVNIETGELLFQWSAADHFDVTESYRPIGGDGSAHSAMDFFHMNSIDKDDHGNYLISSRYMFCLTYVSGETGEILWRLGGKKNNFKDLSGGEATNFAYSHHARWHADSIISIFDNAADDGHTLHKYTRGILVKLDLEAMTAELVQQYMSPAKISTPSQGSMQVLDNANVLLGYGNTGAYTEFAPNGTVLCETHIGAQKYFHSGDVQSYRTFKHAWKGFPITQPAVKLVDNGEDWLTIYVSWFGATEVANWVLEGSDHVEAADDAWVELDILKKDGFETDFEVLAGYPQFLRLKGVQADGYVLGHSGALDVQLDKSLEVMPTIRLDGENDVSLMLLIVFATMCGLATGVREAMIWNSAEQQFSLLRPSTWRRHEYASLSREEAAEEGKGGAQDKGEAGDSLLRADLEGLEGRLEGIMGPPSRGIGKKAYRS